jgi:hypothetical protein
VWRHPANVGFSGDRGLRAHLNRATARAEQQQNRCGSVKNLVIQINRAERQLPFIDQVKVEHHKVSASTLGCGPAGRRPGGGRQLEFRLARQGSHHLSRRNVKVPVHYHHRNFVFR